MKFKNLVSVEILMALIAFFIALFVLLGVSTACNCPEFFGNTGLELGTANPAAIYCEELGYDYNITTDNENGQRGICVFPDNSSCDAWDFFTGKCGANYSWCAVNGCGIKTVSDGRNQYSPEYAVCVLPDKTTEPVTEMMKLNEKVSVDSIKTDYLGSNTSTEIREDGYTAAANPPSFSWRNKDGQDWITPVKDQASCGSCWAFAAVGSAEAKINIARNDSDFDPNLAEQYLVSDCCEYCGDCGGGWSDYALGFIKTEGISDEPCFPYTASDCPCSFRCSAWNKRLWYIDDYEWVPSGRENIKRYLIEKGPLVAYVCMNGYFDANGIYRCGKSPILNHAVVLVGYDDTESCWIAKNSWGASWNGNGYFKIGYGECGIEDYSLYIDLTKEQTEDFRANNIKVITGSKSGDLNDTLYKDGDYITLSEKCNLISCDGLNAIINLSVNSLQNITSMDLLSYHRARQEGGFSLQYWDENSDQWISLGGVPDSTWYLMKYKICDSQTECANYLSNGNVSAKYYHPSCSLCDTDYVDIDWLYLEAFPEKLYCDAYTDNANFEWISRVALNTGEKISGSSTYSDYTTEVLTTLSRGETYTLQVDGHTTGSYPEFVKAWIDFNNDNDFNEADEEINLNNCTFVGNHTFNAQFNVPLDADLSDTRMRVYLKYQNEPQACENASYGEVEDYTIRISSAALFADNYTDYGIDVDEPPNDHYDYLAIDVGVNITESGYYEIYGSLYDELGSYIGSAYNYSYLNIGSPSVILKFDGINIRRNGVNGTYTLKNLHLFNNKYDQLDYRYEAYTTLPYNYTDFEPNPAMFTGVFRDYGQDTDSDGLYDYLVVEKEVAVLKTGNYELSGQLYTPNGTYVGYDWDYTTLTAGLHNVSLKFRGWDIYRARENGNFEVEMYLYYYPSEGTSGVVNISKELDMTSHRIVNQTSFEESEIPFVRNNDNMTNLTFEEVGYTWLDYILKTTSYYTYTSFEQPPGEFNDQFSDFGEDTDSDGLYNYLVINVGVKVNEAGDFQVNGYLYDEQSHQVDYDYNYTFLDTGNQTVQLRFEGIKIRKNMVNGTFGVSLYLYDYLTGYNLDSRYYTTSHYNYTDFQIPPAELNDVYNDYGEDIDDDGLYNYLVVNVGVGVREAGDYNLYGELYENGTYNYIDYDSNTTYLNEGMKTIQLRFEGIKIRNNEYNGTYDLRYIYLYDANYPTPPPTPSPTVPPTPTPALPPELELRGDDAPVGYGEQLDYRNYGYTTSYYEYTEFQIPPAKFNDVYSDYGEDTDSDGLYNYLVINVSLDVREAGNYRVSGDLYENETYNWVDWASNTTYLSEGDQVVQLRFDAWAITRSGTYDLKYLYLYDANYPTPPPTPSPTVPPTPTPALPPELELRVASDAPVGYGEQLDYRYYAYTTGYYEPLPRPALLNDVYSDSGEDTEDLDELYNYLVINVGVNVSEIGTYRVIGELHESGKYNLVDSASNTAYLNHLGYQTIALEFDGVKIRNSGYNGTYDLRYLYLFDANYPVSPTPTLTATPTPTSVLFDESELKAQDIPVGYGELLDYRYYAYTTSYYDYTVFQIPIPDAYEPDDNCSLANYIPVNGTKQIHDFHVPSDHDWLKFNATEGNAYIIETSDLGPESDTYLYLYDTNGTTEIRHDDDSGIGLASKIVWNCGASGTYYIMVRHYSSSAFGQETRYNISINFTILSARFNDVYSDYGLDTDSNGFFDYLAIDVGVNVSKAGYYEITGELYNSSGWYIGWVSNYTTLNAGNQTVQLRFNGAKIWQSRTNGTFNLRYLYLYNASDWSQLDYRYTAYTTKYYNYTDFRPPAVFMPGVEDYGYDENSNGLYEYLIIEKQINVVTAGNYELDGYLINNSGYQIDSNYNYTYLNAGIHNLTLKFRGYMIYNSKSTGNITVYMDLYGYSISGLPASIDYKISEKQFEENRNIAEPMLSEIEDANISSQDIKPLAVSSQQLVGVSSWGWLDSAQDITSYYSYAQFERPPARFNDVYSDYGLDTDSNGFFDYLAIDVGVNVSKAGYYEITGELYNSTGWYVGWVSNYTTLNAGNHTVQLRFNGAKIWQSRTNGTFNLRYLYLYNASDWNQLDYRYDADTTRYYNYTDFQPPTPDAYEPDDNCSLANYIPVNGTKQTHDFHVPGDHDWLKFNATEGNAYTIETSDLGPESDTYLYLYDTDGTTEITHDDDSGIGLASRIIWNCGASGTYYIMVRHYSSSAFGPETRYNISVAPTDTILPVVTIISPVDGSTINTPTVNVIGFATDNVGIEEMCVGVVSEGGGGGGCGGGGGPGPINLSFNYTVDLKEGLNTITVTAIDRAGNSGNASVVVTCNYSGCTPPDLPWNLTISATNQLEPVVVGMHPNATDGYDPEFDAFVQTPVQGKVILLLDSIYSTSIKKTRCYNESVSWNLTVGVPAGQNTTLSWAVPSNVNLTILEGDTVLANGTQLGEGSHELTVIAELIEYIEYCIPLKAGWNMVSIPVIPDNRSVQAIFGSIPTLTAMPVKTWVSPLFVTVDEIEPKKGYWIFTPAAITINGTGKPITNTTLNLKAGWNMVGTVGLENLSIDEIPNQVPQCPAVTYVAPLFVDTDVIEPGKAAWVFVTQNTIVTTGETYPFEMKVVSLQSLKVTKTLNLGTTEEWNLTISSTNQLEPVTFGLHPTATDNYDFEYDAFVQTPIQGKVILILDEVYATEINNERTTWNLSVGVPAGSTANLTWNSSRIPADVNLTLDGTDMKAENYLLLGEGSHSFVIVATGLPESGLFANLSPDIVELGGNFTLSGTAYGQNAINIVIVAPKGSDGNKIDGMGAGIYFTKAAVLSNFSYSKVIEVGTDVDIGNYLVVVLSPGRDAIYNGFAESTQVGNFESHLALEYNLTGKTQQQVCEILTDATVESPGSDDLLTALYVTVIPKHSNEFDTLFGSY